MEKWYGKSCKVGILGGGQLGRMILQKAPDWDVHIHVLDPDPEAPCKNLAASFTCGDWKDYDTVMDFAKNLDVVTVEIEHINVDALFDLQKQGVKVFPQPELLATVQDKGLQKEFYQKNNIPTAPFSLWNLGDELPQAPFVQKMRKGGYDGKGVQVIQSEADFSNAFDVPAVIEEMIPFEKELSVIVARNENGETATFPLVEQEFNPEANLVEFLFAPAHVSVEIAEKAEQLAKKVANAFELVGILAVELFLTKEGDLLVNEVAPRPHNSGHHTIEAGYTSQFEQHLRAILNLPLGDTSQQKAAVMVNLLGAPNHKGTPYYENLEWALQQPGVFPHIYGKSLTKPFRKMGHVTVVHENMEQAKMTARKVLDKVKVITK